MFLVCLGLKEVRGQSVKELGNDRRATDSFEQATWKGRPSLRGTMI